MATFVPTGDMLASLWYVLQQYMCHRDGEGGAQHIGDAAESFGSGIVD